MPLLMLLSLPNIPFCLTLCMKTFMTATVNYTVSTALCIYYYLAFNKHTVLSNDYGRQFIHLHISISGTNEVPIVL